MEKTTLESIIQNSFSVFDSAVTKDLKGLPPLAKSRAFAALLLLSSVVKEDSRVTPEIVSKISLILRPVLGDRITSDSRYRSLCNPKLYALRPDDEEYRIRVYMACGPLEYIQQWFFESEEDTPFDLQEYSELYSVIKTEAKSLFKQKGFA